MHKQVAKIIRDARLDLQRRSEWFRRLRWLFGICAPYRRAELHLAREGEVGDVLLCTPMLRAIKARNPHCRIYFYSKFGELLQGLSCVERNPLDGRVPSPSHHLGL